MTLLAGPSESRSQKSESRKKGSRARMVEDGLYLSTNVDRVCVARSEYRPNINHIHVPHLH